MTTLERVANYNNFYEFTTDKERVAVVAAKFVARPWTVTVDGMVHKPKVFDIDEVFGLGRLEERIYRMRCVEGWSMVIPWAGIPLARLLDQVRTNGRGEVRGLSEPARPRACLAKRDRCSSGRTSRDCGSTRRCTPSLSSRSACTEENCRPKTVRRFASLFPGSMGSKGSNRSSRSPFFRIGRRQLGTLPLRPNTVSTPTSTQMSRHPRWSQATEQRIGEAGRRPTLLFNGYAEQVAHLYRGMNLRINF